MKEECKMCIIYTKIVDTQERIIASFEREIKDREDIEKLLNERIKIMEDINKDNRTSYESKEPEIKITRPLCHIVVKKDTQKGPYHVEIQCPSCHELYSNIVHAEQGEIIYEKKECIKCGFIIEGEFTLL